MGGDGFQHTLPVAQSVVGAHYLQVRRDAQDARADFLLEAVHHRQHHDQRHHPQADAQHGDQRDEGDEMVAALGAGVTQADEKFVGLQGRVGRLVDGR